MDHREIVEAIVRGELDQHLSYIQEAIRLRRNIDAQLLRIELRKGDRVRFVPTIRPKYLAGVEATFVERKSTRVVVDLDERHGRFFRGVNVPMTLLERVNDV
jgi:hypothetical protein